MTIDTSTGGGRNAFPETVWSSILSCPDANSRERRASLNRLLSAYWKPVYAFIRASREVTVEDAKDLTQEFFCRVLDGDLFARYRPQRGRFRHFLKAALRNFLTDVHRGEAALKRGGDRSVLPLDVEKLETQAFLADARQCTPEQLFDRQWVRAVVAQAIERLGEALARDGKEAYFRVYEACELRGLKREEAGAPLGLSVGDVKNYLDYARARLRQIITETVSQYVQSADDLLDELNDLFPG